MAENAFHRITKVKVFVKACNATHHKKDKKKLPTSALFLIIQIRLQRIVNTG